MRRRTTRAQRLARYAELKAQAALVAPEIVARHDASKIVVVEAREVREVAR